jgi:hypothetical protein
VVEQREGCWFTGEATDWNLNVALVFLPLVFLPQAKLDVVDLIHQLLRASPERWIIFSTDNQSLDIRLVCGDNPLGLSQAA